MSQEQSIHQLPAPCIIDNGIVVNKDDMHRLLTNLGRVKYIHTLEEKLQVEDEGFVVEVFGDPHQSTLIVNGSLHLNVQSFDYLQLHRSENREAYFDLIQDNRQLRLIPLSNPLEEQVNKNLDVDALEAMVAQVLSAKWDVQIDEDDCPF
ncbi:MAG: hypothetical protein WA865_17235 [Spirulinaceae cyanobacterium]